MSLDGLWEFAPDPEQRFCESSLSEAGNWRRIRVPGPWQAQFEDLRHYSGVAWYRRSFELPRSLSETTLLSPIYALHFGAVDYYCSVWLNGEPIGEHEGGYLPFEMPVDGSLNHTGNNDLLVRVIDPGDDTGRFSQFSFSEIPHGKQSWYGPIGGIWQSVFLEARHKTHIKRLRVTPDVSLDRASVDIVLNRPLDQAARLALVVTDPLRRSHSTDLRMDEGQDRALAQVEIADPMLWDTHSPHLYRLEATMEDEATGRKLDSTGANFGMRSISTSADGHLMLNGRILYLRGALDQDYYPEMIYTPFSDAELDEQFTKARHMGLNCLRTHIKITDPRYYDAADRAGILIWTELPNWENLTPKVKERARETLDGMVERDWNHPSIIIWTIVNEGWGVDLAVNPDHRAWLAETYDHLKQIDPNRLVVGNSACFTNFHVVTDIEDFHNYYSIPDHYRQWRTWLETFAARPPWTFAHTYKDIDSWREFLRDPWKPVPRTPAPEVRRSGREPMVVSEFGNWGLPDLEKLRACYGGKDPWWFETGMEYGDGAVYPHGADERFRRWHLDKVFPTFSDLALASQRMQYCALKHQIEQIRRHPSIVGYIITEFTDVHWECNGLLDMCRNTKSFFDVIAGVNGADALVPNWKRIAFWEGEKCEVDIAISHFSNLDLRAVRLDWHLDLMPHVSGSFDGLTPRRAETVEVGTVSFKVPAVEQSSRVRLELRLLDATGDVITRNHLELYFFPRAAGRPTETTLYAQPRLAKKLQAIGYRLTESMEAADLVIVDRMTDEFRWYVQNGGRVLWLAESNNSQQTYLRNVEIAPRSKRKWQGDWASNMNWIRQDRMFQDIRTGGLVDFAFADLTPEHVITGLSPRDFASDVHAGLFVGWLHHIVALVAERSFGSGRLLISTFRLRDHITSNPVAALMLRGMIGHLSTP
jgi:hypothetical protein